MSDQDPVAWLRQRVRERMYLARHAIELGSAVAWTELSSGVLMTCDADAPQDRDGIVLGDSSLTRLMEANDPQDTIARCEAELAILDEHAPEFTDYIDGDGIERGSWECSTCEPGGTPDNWPCRTVRLLASGYRHKGGYEEAGWGTASGNSPVVLTSGDPQPRAGTLVRDDCGTEWRHDGDGGYWLREDDPGGDPESWTKIAGNYGPVTVLEVPQD